MNDPQINALRIPPHSIEAEQSVLGGLLLDNEAFDRIADLLQEEDFYRHEHRLIWRYIARLISHQYPADVVTVYEALQQSGEIEEIKEGLPYLSSLAQETPSSANIRRYAEIVRDRSVLRRLLSASQAISSDALNPQGRDIRQLLDEAESKIFKISEEKSRGQSGFQPLSELLTYVVERVDELYRQNNPNDVTGIPTGFIDLDRMTSGLQPGELIVVAGRPSMGKAQPLDALVKTPSGWSEIGKLKTGDALSSIDGEPSKVLKIFDQAVRQVYRMHFSDGRSAECCGEHLWRVYHENWNQPKILETDTLRSILKESRMRQRFWVDRVRGGPDSSYIVSIEQSRWTKTRCISVSHYSHLYLTNNQIPTHNTAFSLNIGEYVSIEHGLPVAVFSMEMGASQLAMRVICSIGRFDQQRLRVGRLHDGDWPRLTAAVQKIQEAQLFIDETPALNAIDLRARARRLSRQCGKLGAIIVDYLQLMAGSSTGSSENRATEISEISRSLKALAKELDCPVIALSQLNRSLEQRPNKRPIMSDLRESGAIEQDADVILFIYRDEVYNPDSADKGTAEIIIGKQRNGPIGSIRLAFCGKYTRFENFTYRTDSD